MDPDPDVIEDVVRVTDRRSGIHAHGDRIAVQQRTQARIVFFRELSC